MNDPIETTEVSSGSHACGEWGDEAPSMKQEPRNWGDNNGYCGDNHN